MTTEPELDLTAEATAEGGIVHREIVEDLSPRPDITKAHIAAMVAAAAQFGNAFGIYHLNQAQQDSLTMGTIAIMAIVGGDAVIRFGRNLAKGI